MALLGGLGSMLPDFGSWQSLVSTLIWGLVLIGGITFGAIWVRNKIKYQYFGIVLRRRQSLSKLPESVISYGKAGYFVNKKKGRTVFRIKYGKMPWQMFELSKLPDPEFMVGNMVIYEQLNKDNLVQCKMDVDWSGGLSLKPVEDDLKHAAYLDFYEKEQVLSTSRLTPLTVGFIVLGVILTAGIIVFYFLSKA